MSNLSGGEKTVAALALLFAIHRYSALQLLSFTNSKLKVINIMQVFMAYIVISSLILAIQKKCLGQSCLTQSGEFYNGLLSSLMVIFLSFQDYL